MSLSDNLAEQPLRSRMAEKRRPRVRDPGRRDLGDGGMDEEFHALPRRDHEYEKDCVGLNAAGA